MLRWGNHIIRHIRRELQKVRLDYNAIPAGPALETSSIKSAILDDKTICQTG